VKELFFSKLWKKEMDQEKIFACTIANRAHDKKSCYKLKKKEAQNNHACNFNVIADRRNYNSKDVVFMATLKNEILTDDIWICDNGACGHYCKPIKGLFDVKDINQKIIVRNGERMKVIKVGKTKCHDIQLYGSSVNVTLKEVKYVPELWVNLFSIR
jgi:cupin superfamily acireductone dioxygenase involved in methionine salvage